MVKCEEGCKESERLLYSLLLQSGFEVLSVIRLEDKWALRGKPLQDA